MKNFITTFVLLLAFGFTANAQQINLSPKIGINYSYFNDNFDEDRIDEYDEIESRTGYQIGLDVRFGEKLYVAPGVHYVQLKNNLLNSDVNFTTDVLRVPVMVGGDLFEADRWGLRAYVGPSFMIALNENDELIDVVQDWVRKDFTISLDAGVGIDLGIITIDLQHAWGVNNFLEWNGVDLKNRAFFLSAGLLF